MVGANESTNPLLMQINVADYEKLGSFYLGREYDQKARAMKDGLIMYDSKDLVTHGWSWAWQSH